MVKKLIPMVMIVFWSSISHAQSTEDPQAKKEYEKKQNEPEMYTGFVHPGLFLFRASLAVGGMTAIKANNVFIEGNMEYFIDRRVSIRGDGYYFAAHTSDYQPFKMHHSLFTGAMFHQYTKGDFDPYAGLEVGINFAQATDQCMGGVCTAVLPPEPVTKVASPTLSPVIGFNYYGGKFFHLTVHARYIVGKFMDNYNVVSLGEWRVSFGLGFNLSRRLVQRNNGVINHF